MPAIRAIHGWGEITKDEYTVSANATKASAKTLNGALTGDWLVGSQPSVADYMVASFFLVASQTFLDGGFRKAMPKFGAWLARVFALPAYVSVAG
jgi:glutathione S-transferase